MKRALVKSTIKWAGRILYGSVTLFVLAVAVGTPPSDMDKMRRFATAVDRWQTGPDFRKIQIEYVEMGSEAMRTRVAFATTTDGIMFLRSLPGLPAHLKVNDTSFAHYTNFTRGPLSAYLHLMTETGELKHTLQMLDYISKQKDLTNEQIRKDFILNYKFDGYKVASDDGACDSVSALINEVDAARGFKITDHVAERLKPHIAAVAGRLGYPSEVTRMTPEQQTHVRDLLDGQVKETDYELWRIKQVNDWLNGLWSQVYGTMYAWIIGPTLTLRGICLWLGPLMLISWVGLVAWNRKKRAALHAAPAADAESPLSPQPNGDPA